MKLDIDLVISDPTNHQTRRGASALRWLLAGAGTAVAVVTLVALGGVAVGRANLRDMERLRAAREEQRTSFGVVVAGAPEARLLAGLPVPRLPADWEAKVLADEGWTASPTHPLPVDGTRSDTPSVSVVEVNADFKLDAMACTGAKQTAALEGGTRAVTCTQVVDGYTEFDLEVLVPRGPRQLLCSGRGIGRTAAEDAMRICLALGQ